jgi:hypothetical protein
MYISVEEFIYFVLQTSDIQNALSARRQSYTSLITASEVLCRKKNASLF